MKQPIDPNTRRFLKTLAAGGAAVLAAPALRASPAPALGKDYREVKPPQQTDSAGKLEVLEFFWYGCPHCNAFEPSLHDWTKRLPGDVAFHKVHVGLTPAWVAHQQLFYTLQALGKAEQLNDKVFRAIHVDRNPLNNPELMADFAAQNGIDRKQFLDAYASFTVRTRMRKASQQAAAYGLEGVPALAVNGRWFTAPSMAGGNGEVLQVLDFLLARERTGGK
jgi:thiol:disulfide interchange protein DsbA